MPPLAPDDRESSAMLIAHSSRASTLPLEIWMTIFKLATEVPWALDSSLRSPLDLTRRPEDPRRMRNLNRQSLQTKLALLLVCRSWHGMTRERMVEYVAVASEEGLGRVARVLQASKLAALLSSSNGTKLIRPLGWFVKRLDFFFTYRWTRPALESIVRIVQHCPNLAVVTDGLTSARDLVVLPKPSVFSSIFEHCGRSLRRLEWKFSDFPDFDVAALFRSLTMAPNLEVLSLLFITSTPSRVDTPLPHVSLPKLHTLEFGYWASGRIIFHSGEWDLPLIKRVVASINPHTGGPFTFMNNHGPKLESFEISDDTYTLDIAQALISTDNLQELILNIELEQTQLPVLKRLVRIGLTGLSRLGDDTLDEGAVLHMLKRRLDSIVTNLERLPALRIVRLIDLDLNQFDYLHRVPGDVEWWDTTVVEWTRKGIRFEDRQGDVIRAPAGAATFQDFLEMGSPDAMSVYSGFTS